MDDTAGPSRAGFQVGEILAGKYRVERLLGAGGMGVVVAAQHIALDERVALKLLLPEALHNPEAVARFLREARAAVKIKSEHVARVSDVGRLDDGSPYMVMEYLEGGDLAAWIRGRGAMSFEQAVDFVLQACEAVAEAHSLGIVHRDLKPANLYCAQRADGELAIKVLDFGISKITTAGAEGHGMTSTTAVVGSPSYMSPEQLQSSKGVDTRTDIWSLGVILFELLTTRTPFHAETLTELIIQIATAPAPDVRTLRQDTPARLAQAIACCLEKDRARRFVDVAGLARALEPFGSKRARTSVERVFGTLRSAATGAVALPGSATPLVEVTRGTGAPAATAASWGKSGATTRGLARRTAPWLGLGMGAVGFLMLAIGSVSLARRAGRTPASVPIVASGPPSSAPDPSASLPPEAPDTGDSGAPAPTDSALAPPPETAVQRAPSPPATNPRTVGTVPHPVPGALPGKSSAPAPSCNPNYTLDDQGRKHFKPECFLH